MVPQQLGVATRYVHVESTLGKVSGRDTGSLRLVWMDLLSLGVDRICSRQSTPSFPRIIIAAGLNEYKYPFEVFLRSVIL